MDRLSVPFDIMRGDSPHWSAPAQRLDAIAKEHLQGAPVEAVGRKHVPTPDKIAPPRRQGRRARRAAGHKDHRRSEHGRRVSGEWPYQTLSGLCRQAGREARGARKEMHATGRPRIALDRQQSAIPHTDRVEGDLAGIVEGGDDPGDQRLPVGRFQRFEILARGPADPVKWRIGTKGTHPPALGDGVEANFFAQQALLRHPRAFCGVGRT